MTGSQRLTFDDIELIDVSGGDEGGFTIQAIAGTRFGNPVPVESVVESFLRDGSIISKEGDENREMNVLVQVSAPDGIALAAGGQRLNLATGKRTTLAWTPPDGFGPTTVFDVLTSSLSRVEDDWDLDEVRGVRTYSLRLICLPFGRSTTLTTEVAEGIPSVGTTVNAADSLTGWSTPTAVVPGPTFGSYVNASPQPSSMLAVDTSSKVEGTGSVAAKAFQVQAVRFIDFLPTGDGRQVETSLTLTQAISVAAGSYLSFAVKLDNTWGRTITNSYWNHTFQQWGTLNTFTLTTASSSRTYKNEKSSGSDFLLQDGIIEALPNGWKRYTFRIDTAMSVTSLKWTSQHLVPYLDDASATERPRILVDQVALTASATLGNQVLKSIDVGGSARTTGAIHVAAPSDSVALGPTLVYTVPERLVADGWRPDIKQFVGAGATVSTVGGRAGVYSGVGINYGGGSPVFTIPASALQSGAYTVAMLGYWNTLSSQVTIEASLLMGATVVATQELDVTLTTTLTTWQFQVLGTMYLPPMMVQTPSSNATVRFRIKTPGSPIVAFDNIYLLPVEGDLSIIDCGTGTVGPTASSHLWIDSPSPEQPQGGYWRGTTPNRSDALSAWSTSVVPGTHTFEAGRMLAFAVSDAAGPTVSFEYYKRWLDNAKE